jgi:hypothetical protein
VSVGVAEWELLELQASRDIFIDDIIRLENVLYYPLRLLHSNHRPDEHNKSRKLFGPLLLSYSVDLSLRVGQS